MKINFKQFTKIVNNSPFLKKLTKRRFNYRHGYLDYKVAMRRVVEWYAAATMLIKPSGLFDRRDEQMSFESCFDMNEDTIFPVYAISSHLTNLFFHTDIPSSLLGIEKPFHSALLMFPPDDRFVDDDGDRVDFVHIKWFDRQDYNSQSRKDKLREFAANSFGLPVDKFDFYGNFEPTEKFRIRCVAFVKSGATINHCFGIYEDGNISNFEAKENRSLIERISNIVLQFVLYLQTFDQHEFQAKTNNRTALDQSRGFSKESINKPKSYIYIDCTPVENDKPSNHNSASNIHSISTHWRRGHWRSISVGKGRCDKKITWIKPTIVNPQNLSA